MRRMDDMGMIDNLRPEIERWLRDQIAADMKAALEATPGPWTVGKGGEVETVALTGTPGYETPAPVTLDQEGLRPSVEREDAEHIARQHPNHVLKRTKADLELLDTISRGGITYAAADYMVRQMAYGYAERPGYQEAWRP